MKTFGANTHRHLEEIENKFFGEDPPDNTLVQYTRNDGKKVTIYFDVTDELLDDAGDSHTYTYVAVGTDEHDSEYTGTAVLVDGTLEVIKDIEP